MSIIRGVDVARVLLYSRVAECMLLLLVVLVEPETVLWEIGVRDVSNCREAPYVIL